MDIQKLKEKEKKKEEALQILEDLKEHPLFTNDPEQLMKDTPENEALRNLLYDEEDGVLAENFYVQGNNILKSKVLATDIEEKEVRYFVKQARVKYLEALKYEIEDKELLAKIYCNLALCNMKLKNYRKVIQQCDSAIFYKKDYLKAYYRKVFSLYEVQDYKECIESSQLSYSYGKEKSILKIEKKAIEKQIEIDKENQKKLFIKKMNLGDLVEHLNKQNILYSLEQTLKIPEIYQPIFKIEKEYIITSIVFMYPEFGQFDFVQMAHQQNSVEQYFKEIFQNGLPWDREHLYKLKNIEFYIKLNEQEPINGKLVSKDKKLHKIENKSTLLEIMQTDQYIVPRILEIIILCKDSSFYSHYKSNN